jgi:hypothetical protein
MQGQPSNTFCVPFGQVFQLNCSILYAFMMIVLYTLIFIVVYRTVKLRVLDKQPFSLPHPFAVAVSLA